MSRTDVRVPDLGDFDAVEVIEVHIKAGDRLEREDPLITVETEKASMDIPSPVAGTVVSVEIAAGGQVSSGDLVAQVDVTEDAAGDAAGDGAQDDAEGAAAPADIEPAPADTESAAGQGGSATASSAAPIGTPTRPAGTIHSGTSAESPGKRVAVLGAGPGGYTAAFRAADLGLDVTLIERWPSLGGVCLNVGCIPSKALLHAARVIEETKEMRAHGIDFGEPRIDTDKLRDWKNSVVGQLTRGLGGMAKQRGVRVVQGLGRFSGPNRLDVERDGATETIEFDQCIIAAGSEPVRLPNVPDDPRIIDSTGALELEALPERLLVVGGGIIGLEMATVYEALGVKVSVVELTKTLIPGCDRDLVRPLQKRLEARYEAIMLGTRVTGMTATEQGIEVSFDGDAAPAEPQVYGRVLVAVGRRPNGRTLNAEAAGVAVDERGFIAVDRQQRTNVPHIFAIGDIVGQPMLAHKASHEGKIAAEVAAGEKSHFDARGIPAVAYTDPEVAWVGQGEEDAKARNVPYRKGVFPWAASGRSLSLGRSDGLTKLLFDPETGRVIGAGIVGPNAGDLISEAALAIEMGCDAEDIGLTVHPHPTLSETIAFAAEVAAGTVTDLYIPKR